MDDFQSTSSSYPSTIIPNVKLPVDTVCVPNGTLFPMYSSALLLTRAHRAIWDTGTLSPFSVVCAHLPRMHFVRQQDTLVSQDGIQENELAPNGLCHLMQMTFYSTKDRVDRLPLISPLDGLTLGVICPLVDTITVCLLRYSSVRFLSLFSTSLVFAVCGIVNVSDEAIYVKMFISPADPRAALPCFLVSPTSHPVGFLHYQCRQLVE